MHKIDSSTAVGGEFVSGNPSTGQQATKLNAGWFNSVQRELCNLLADNGIALSDSNDSQIANLLHNLIRGVYVKEHSYNRVEIDADGIKVPSTGNYGILIDATDQKIIIDAEGGGSTEISSEGVKSQGSGEFNVVECSSLHSNQVLSDNGISVGSDVSLSEGSFVIGDSMTVRSSKSGASFNVQCNETHSGNENHSGQITASKIAAAQFAMNYDVITTGSDRGSIVRAQYNSVGRVRVVANGDMSAVSFSCYTPAGMVTSTINPGHAKLIICTSVTDTYDGWAQFSIID